MQMDTQDLARKTVLRAVAWGVLAGLTVLIFDLIWVEEPGQAWPVRWLRLAAEHPLRMGLVGAGLCLTCRLKSESSPCIKIVLFKNLGLSYLSTRSVL